MTHDVVCRRLGVTLLGVAARRWSNRRGGQKALILLAGLAVCLWIPTAGYLTLADSVPSSMHNGLNSTFGHVGMGLALTSTGLVLVRALGGGRRLPWPTVLAVAGVSFTFLVATELLQSFTDTRTTAWSDVGADLFGVVTATLLVAGPIEPAWLARLRRGPLIPLVGVATALGLVGSVATGPDNLRVQTGMASGPVGCITTLDHPEATPTVAPLGAPFDTAPDTGGDNDGSQPLVDLDLTSVDGQRIDGGAIQFDVLTDSTVAGPGPGTAVDGMIFPGDRTAVRSSGGAEPLTSALHRSQAFTVAVTFAPDNLEQNGPTRLLSISDGTAPDQINFQLGLEREWLSLRIRSACNIWNWMALSKLPEGPSRLTLTYDDGIIDAWINGAHTGHAEIEGGDLGTWNTGYPVVVGNEATLNRGFQGTVACVAVVDEAVDSDTARSATRTDHC